MIVDVLMVQNMRQPHIGYPWQPGIFIGLFNC